MPAQKARSKMVNVLVSHAQSLKWTALQGVCNLQGEAAGSCQEAERGGRSAGSTAGAGDPAQGGPVALVYILCEQKPSASPHLGHVWYS